MSDVQKKLRTGRPRKGCAVVVENDSADQFPGIRQEDAVVQKGSVSVVKDSASRLRKPGAPLPFPIEASLSVG